MSDESYHDDEINDVSQLSPSSILVTRSAASPAWADEADGMSSSVRLRKRVAIADVPIDPDNHCDEGDATVVRQKSERSGSLLVVEPRQPLNDEDEEDNEEVDPSSTSAPLHSSPPAAQQLPKASSPLCSNGHTGSRRRTGDFIDSIVACCNRFSTRAPCRIGGKRLSISLSWCVQWFLVLNLAILVIGTTLLFNYYALTLINDTADSYLHTALWQTQVAMDQSFAHMKECLSDISQSAGGVHVISADGTTWPGWGMWAVPGFGLFNASQATSWSAERRLAHVAVVESCRVMGEGKTAVQLAYRLVSNGWIGGCVNVGSTTSTWATSLIGFTLFHKRVVWLQSVPGETSTAARRLAWIEKLERMSWIDDPLQLAELLEALWSLPRVPRERAAPIVAIDVPPAQQAAADETATNSSVCRHQNTTWILEPFPNGTVASINAVQWTKTRRWQLLDRAPAHNASGTSTHDTHNNNSSAGNTSRSHSVSLTPSTSSSLDPFMDSFTIMNISAMGQLTGVLDRVAQLSSDGVSIDIVDDVTGAVLSWSSAAGYYIAPSSFIHGRGLQPYVRQFSEVSNSWTVDPPDGTASLYNMAATAWTIRVSSGESIVGSLATGTYVVLVVCVAIAVAVSIGGLMTLRLLLNPLDQVHRDMHHASALQFHRIDASKFPPSILREMNLVTRSFLQLVKKLRSYRSVLLDVYDSSLRSRSSSLASTSSELINVSMDSRSAFGSSFASSSGGDTLESSSSFVGQLSASLATGTAEDLEFLSSIRKGSFVNPVHETDNSLDDALDLDNQHLVKVQLAYISRRHSGRQRKQVTLEHTYRDGDPELLHKFRTDCLKSLHISVFEEVRLQVQCNGVYVDVRNDTQMADAFSVARGELLVRVSKCSVKKVLSPVALLVDLLNFVMNIALITLGLNTTRAGTPERLSINVFFGLYAAGFIVNLCITLLLLKQGQRDPRMKAWLSQAGLEVSLMLIFCALNTQNIHFLWSQWSLGLKYNAPRIHFLWKRGIMYSLFGFVALDLMQVMYKGYRVIGGEDLIILSIVSLLTACVSIALSLKKRVDFVVYCVSKWRSRSGSQSSVSGTDVPTDAANEEEMDQSFREGGSWARRPRAGLSCPIFSEEATVIMFRCCVASPDVGTKVLDRHAQQRQHNKAASHLNRFFSLVFSEVAQAQGHVLWFHGTEVAASFNSPKPLEHHTSKALKCALQVHRGFRLIQQSAAAVAGAALPTQPPIGRTDAGASHAYCNLVVAIVRGQYMFGTLGGAHKRVFQCFADWDELQRMLNFAESAGHLGIVTNKYCVPHLTNSETPASPGGVPQGGGRDRPPGDTPASTRSHFLDSLVYHDVLGADQAYVEIPFGAAMREKRHVSVLARVLRPLGVLLDPLDEALAVFTTFVSDFISSEGRRLLPTEEATALTKRKAVTICLEHDGPPNRQRSSADSPPICLPSALKKYASPSAPKAHDALSDDLGSSASGDDDEPGMSAETRQPSSSSGGRSWKRSTAISGSAAGAGVTLGTKDMLRMFPDAF